MRLRETCAVIALLAGLAGAPFAAEKPAPPAAASEGRDGSWHPVCVRVGTRSEGWAWPNGEFIHWAKCKGVIPKCYPAGGQHEVEGWYANGVLVVAARCADADRKSR
jgi:hypothetical protein